MKLLRPMLNVILFVAIFVAPFWLPLTLLFLGLLALPYYFEAVIALFCLELLYAGSMPAHEALVFYAPIIITIFFFAVQWLRRLASERIFSL